MTWNTIEEMCISGHFENNQGVLLLLFFLTQGCLPTVLHSIGIDYHSLSRGVWLPVCAMHVALVSECISNY